MLPLFNFFSEPMMQRLPLLRVDGFRAGVVRVI